MASLSFGAKGETRSGFGRRRRAIAAYVSKINRSQVFASRIPSRLFGLSLCYPFIVGIPSQVNRSNYVALNHGDLGQVYSIEMPAQIGHPIAGLVRQPQARAPLKL